MFGSKSSQASTANPGTGAGNSGSNRNPAMQQNGPSSTDVAQQPPRQAARYADAALTPPVDVIEDSSGITLYADLPGVPRENLRLQVEADTLTIEADSAMAVPDGLQSSHTEVGLGRFHRAFSLSKELDTENVTAELAHGVLKLRIPKAAHAQPRRISVKAG